MAQHTVNANETGIHLTLTAGTVETITFASDISGVEVSSRDGQSNIWFTVDGTTPSPNGKRSYCVPTGAIGADERPIPNRTGATTIKLVAESATLVSVYRSDTWR